MGAEFLLWWVLCQGQPKAGRFGHILTNLTNTVMLNNYLAGQKISVIDFSYIFQQSWPTITTLWNLSMKKSKDWKWQGSSLTSGCCPVRMARTGACTPGRILCHESGLGTQNFLKPVGLSVRSRFLSQQVCIYFLFFKSLTIHSVCVQQHRTYIYYY